MLRNESSKNATSGRDPAERAKYAKDPKGYFRDILKIDYLTEDQERFLDEIMAGNRVLAKAANAVGKCLESQSLIPLADGHRVRAADLVGQEFQLLTIDERGCIVAADARADWNVIEDVYEVATESGRRVTVNAQHPLYAADYLGRHGKPGAAPIGEAGWRAVRDLREGDAVAVPTELPAFGDEEHDLSFIKVVAYLLAEGSFTGGKLQFHQNPGPVMDEFTACLDALGIEWRLAQHHNRVPCVSVRWGTTLGRQLEAMGLRDATSHTVRFPDFVWRLPKHQLALFVNRLWAGDGGFHLRKPTVKAGVTGTAEYTSVSEQMVRDMQHALLRLGVSVKIGKRKTGYNRPDGTRWQGEAWRVLVIGADSLVRLGDALGPVPGKEDAQAACVAVAGGVTGKRNPKRYTPWRDYGLPASLRWEKVASIEPKGQKMTVAIEVPGYHTYLTDLYEHNTHLLAAIGVWWMDAVAAQPGEDGREQGAIWIMTAPDANTVDSTIWARALEHIKRAERSGYTMPGEYSERSVLWRVPGDDWFIEKLSPPKRVGQEQQHGASGRHHRNLLITIDEGPGVDAARYRAAEGMASGLGNKIVAAGNPTEIVGPFVEKSEGAEYTTIRISALNHPNVLERREVVPGGAISHMTIDARVKSWCFDRGEFDPHSNVPDEKFMDFLYRLHPWVGDDERRRDIPDPCPAVEEVRIGDKTYKVIGHADAPIHVFRPDSRFLPTVMGHFPLERSSGLFPVVFIDRAFERWIEMSQRGDIRELETRGYDMVGVDPAEEGGDAPMLAPMWRMGQMRVFNRIRDLRRGMDVEVAGSAFMLGGKRPRYVVDAIGVGSGVASRLETDYGCQVERFKASENAWNDEDEPEFYNKRAAAYWRASILLKEGKVVMPPDTELKEELRAHGYENRNGKILVTPKKRIRDDLIGRSPDKADAWVFALWEEREQAEGGAFYVPVGGRAPNTPPSDYSIYVKGS